MKTKFNGILTLLLAFVVQISFAQEKTISGTVSDETGTLPGVSVLIKGTTTGTDTDFDGKYTINAKVGDILSFTYLGYTTVERTVSTSNTINVRMKEGGEVLDEIVVTAYGGAVNSSKIASSFTKVSGETIESVPINSLDQVLQGAAAGVSVNTGSGQPGQSATIIIRGIGSINGDIEPLFVIDGIPVDQDNFRSLNQNDIESLNVLKDAAATAIYGNRGAGGVILVTTKRGKLNQKLKITYRTQYGVAFRPDTKFDVMTSKQFLTYQKNLVPGTQFGDGLSDVEIDALSRQTNTDWSDVFFQLGETQSHELSFTSGSALTTSFTSMQYYKQEGITLGSNLTRFSFRNNSTGSSANKRFNYSTNVTLNYSKNSFIVDAVRGGNTGGQLDNPFIVPYIGLPYLSQFNPDGSLNIIGSRLSGALNADGSINASGANGFVNTAYLALNTAALNTDDENEIRAIIGLNADYKINDNFTIGTSFGLDYTNIQGLIINAPESIRGLITPSQASEIKGSQAERTFRSANFITNAFLRYENEITDKLSISASIYGEYNYSNSQNEGFTAFGLNPALPTSGSGFTSGNTVEFPGGDPTDLTDQTFNYIPTVFSSESDIALASVFGLVDLDYDGKYGFSGSLRRDSTSRFPNNPDGTFYSVAGRWNIDKEEFMQDVDWLNLLKFRISYGEVGNQNVGSRYQGLQTVSAGNGYQLGTGYTLGTLVDESIQWETTTTLNVGLSFGLWNNKLSGEIDYYNSLVSDLFAPKALSPSGTGYTTVNANVGEMSNKGVDLQLAYNVLNKTSTNPWGIKLTANGNYNKNKVEELDGIIGNTLRTVEGRQSRTWFDVRWAGVDPSNGQPLYLTADGNVTNEYNFNRDAVYLDKNFDPTYTGGFGTDISYKGFALNALFSFAADRYRNNASLAIIEDVGLAGFANQSTTVLNAWTTPGQITDIPALSFGGLRARDGNRYLEDASYLRLRNVNLSYSFDSKLLEKTKVFTGIRVYAQGTNLLTWTKWRGFDPESNQATGFFDYPVARTFTLGFDINF